MMMLEKNKMTIVVEEYSIEEQWVDTVKELLDLLYCKDDDFTQNHRNVLLLLENMMPDYEQVKGMIGVMPEKRE